MDAYNGSMTAHHHSMQGGISMTLKAFSPIPSWLPPFSTVPRGQLITLYSSDTEAPFGKILNDQDHLVWQPSQSGVAVIKAIDLMKESNKIAVVEGFRIMPDRIQIFIRYRKYHKRLPAWFIDRLKKFLATHITGGESPSSSIWKKETHTQLVYADMARQAVIESLHDELEHWRYNDEADEKAAKA